MKKITKSPYVKQDYIIKLKKADIPAQIPEYKFKKYWGMINEVEETGTFDQIWFIIKNMPKILKLVYWVVKIKKGIKSMADKKDFKTTITGIIKAVTLVLGLLGVSLSPENQEIIITAAVSIYGLIEVIQGWFMKDKDKE